MLAEKDQVVCQYGELGYAMHTGKTKSDFFAQAHRRARLYQLAEFYQLQIRIEKLSMCLDDLFDDKTRNGYDLLHEQLTHMISYRNVMKERARMEKIKL